MTHLNKLFARTLVAAALLGAVGAASADVMYHVDINTAGFATGGATTGYLDLSFAGAGALDVLTATVSHLQGDFFNLPQLSDVGVNPDGSLLFDSSLFSDFYAQIGLGQVISFDVSFSGMPPDAGSANFAADLLNGDGSAYLSNAVSFALMPDSAPTVVTDAGVGSVQLAAAVPEPSMLLSLFTGLGLMGLTLRRRRG